MSLFSEEVLEKAKSLTPEKDLVMPGTWHVKSGDNEYRVQTDEEFDEEIRWATCTCLAGLNAGRGTPRCAHVAAVLLAILEEN